MKYVVAAMLLCTSTAAWAKPTFGDPEWCYRRVNYSIVWGGIGAASAAFAAGSGVASASTDAAKDKKKTNLAYLAGSLAAVSASSTFVSTAYSRALDRVCTVGGMDEPATEARNAGPVRRPIMLSISGNFR